MTSKIFIDTNILVYAMDKHNIGKQQNCRRLLKSLAINNLGVISTQVLQEFYVVATNKLRIDPIATKDILCSFDRFETVVTTPQLIKDAIDCSILNIVSFWDALIITAAEHANCDKVWTEDLNHGQIIRGVMVENPLRMQ
jgi:predicted nucleic acid-binding protein